MSEDIPQWAKDKAVLLSKSAEPICNWTVNGIYASNVAFAYYIATVAERLADPFSNPACTAIGRVYWAKQMADLMEPPADPLLIEAKRIAAEWYSEEAPNIDPLLAALRRGIELAGEQP